MLFISKHDFLLAQISIAVNIYGLKYFVEVSFLLVFGQMTGDEGQSCLFQFWCALYENDD